MKIQRTTPINFKATQISEVKVDGIKSKYKLYEITPQDYNFLDKLYSNLDIKKLMPEMKDDEYIIWNFIIESAIEKSKASYITGILETCDDIPCGIMSYSKFGNKFNVNYVTTFPNKKENRVPYAGQILFNEIYRRLSNNSEKTKIELQALKDAPFDPVGKYLRLGFSMLGGDNYTEFMRIQKPKAEQILQEQDQFIHSTPINQENIDLDKTLNLPE